MSFQPVSSPGGTGFQPVSSLGGTGAPPRLQSKIGPSGPRRTPDQNRMLHREASARGLTHADIHDLAASRYRVLSTSDMTVTQCADLIDFIRGVRYPETSAAASIQTPNPKPQTRAASGVLRSASTRQRRFIQHLMRDLGWAGGGDDQRAVSWLFDRYKVDWDTLDACTLSTRTASAIIQALNRILLSRNRRGERGHLVRTKGVAWGHQPSTRW